MSSEIGVPDLQAHGAERIVIGKSHGEEQRNEFQANGDEVTTAAEAALPRSATA